MIKQWLANAFAIERPEDFAPTAEQQEIADRVCREIVRRDMVTLAILSLETCRPLNYVGSQAIHFFTPFLSFLVEPRSQKLFAEFLEKRGSIEWLCQRLETLSNESNSLQKTGTTSEKPPPLNPQHSSEDGS
ncbi:hypothetical protein Enr10x_40600 [Gimesia panareensis]|uniref:Uncharacterized protein n=2 Tax=Gimesia panareensis TaxID=2527978 RepID=A0A517QAV4_9PLAN|nr:hypothetical protein Enr10x_40600 [Gimesia panareensis]